MSSKFTHYCRRRSISRETRKLPVPCGNKQNFFFCTNSTVVTEVYFSANVTSASKTPVTEGETLFFGKRLYRQRKKRKVETLGSKWSGQQSSASQGCGGSVDMVKACVRNQTCAVLTPVNFRDSLVVDGTVCGRTQAQSLLGAMRRKMAIASRVRLNALF